MSVAEQRLVPLQELVLIPELSPRSRLCEETVIRYMESFSSLPPVRVQAKTNVVVDGYHRVEAAVRLGLETVPAQEESIADDELRLVAGLSNTRHGQPLTRTERNTLAVALVTTYGKLREEVAGLLGMSAAAVTLALREHQFNEQLSEKLGSPVQVVNSAHVRALYRVGPEQRERLLEAVVSKVDDDGRPYPLTGGELKLLVDRMLDPATPTAELNRLLNDPKARPKPSVTAAPVEEAAGADPFVPEAAGGGEGSRPWEREWESPLKGGDTEAFDKVRGVDEELDRAGGGMVRERQIADLLGRAEENAHERLVGENPFWGNADAPGPYDSYAGSGANGAAGTEGEGRLREGLQAASRALAEIAPQVQPEEVRRQVEAVLALLQTLG
jgi:ParB-like chromosome segregation protein Spo0J